MERFEKTNNVIQALFKIPLFLVFVLPLLPVFFFCYLFLVLPACTICHIVFGD